MSLAAIEQQIIRFLRERILAGSPSAAAGAASAPAKAMAGPREVPVEAPLGEAGLRLDSLPLLDFFLAIEKTFGIVLPDSVWAQKDRVSVRFLAEHILGQGGQAVVGETTTAAGRAVHVAAHSAEAQHPASLFDCLREDLRRARKENVPPGWWNKRVKIWFFPGTWAVVSYRFSHWALSVRVPVLRQILLVLAGIGRGLSLLLTGVNISPRAEIGPGLVVHTTYGVFVSPTRIGSNCLLQTGVLIAYGVESVGDNVYFGPGAKVVGNVRIGSNVAIAANSLVLTDVPDNVTAIGVPARIFLPREKPVTFERTTTNP
jgi:serine O-acetyltransferase